ncbi:MULTISPECIES: glucosamine-6-phosphate deaminase [Sporosarcina]|uniref:glucosamine-6-phosphate deaminase n=1 Tax=Sporosarcina TaxID=1569 RepID=UPI00129BE3C8|nr:MULTISPECIES: glucosamine-6-phosphate deaminase [Sporosarcina]GKV66574.1 glucosamine-6-phosphate deaminase [Sporosarcina sp. NCCP-2331]GLB56851.1 glucosamine-6-phosphate deaminase [Sporosarcina sp. NCCP-2378]
MNAILQEGIKGTLTYRVFKSREEMGEHSADLAANKIKAALNEKDEVRVIFACAPSQNEMLRHLVETPDIDWSRIVGFHMDEYIGLPEDSTQWFKFYIENHLLSKVSLKEFHFIDGTKSPEKMMEEYTSLLNEAEIDVVCLGIGENGHIAFNDPPVADFNDPFMIKEVQLDQFSRQQQVNDGCFETLDEVPTHALSLTIPALIRAKRMVCTVPGITKSRAVKETLSNEISTDCPSTILRKHNDAYLIMDKSAFGEYYD